jgi:uncharacterized phage-associated protein
MLILQQAQYLINEFGKPYMGGGITPLKLQKMLYYLKAWGLVAEYPLVDAPFLKWTHGPVNYDVYTYLKPFGSNVLQPQPTSFKPADKEKELFDFIGTCYAQFSAVALSAMTHREDPWKVTPKDEEITDESMLAYYSQVPFAKNFPFDPDGPFYPVTSEALASFVLDMNDEDADSMTSYPSYHDYLAYLQRASGMYQQWYHSLLQ